MYDSYKKRLEKKLQIKSLQLNCKIGSPFSPFAISRCLSRYIDSCIFWNPGFIPPLKSAKKKVVFVHDLCHLHYYGKTKRMYYEFVLKKLYTFVDKIVCISEFTKNEFMEWSGIIEDKIVVIPNGIEPDFASISPPKVFNRPYFFYPGNRRTYKNVPLMVTAFFTAKMHRKGFDLLLTGAKDDNLVRIASSFCGEPNLKFLGDISEKELVGYYKGSTGVLYLSKYEGFGLPLLEAMACGRPILVGRYAAIPEVAGNAAVYADLDCLGDITCKIKDIAENRDYIKSIIKQGSIQTQKFNLGTSAAKLYNTLLN